MFNIGGPEVLVILLLALIVLGPSRLPEAARQLGRARAELRKLSSGFQEELRTAFDEESDAAARARDAASASPPVAVEPTAAAAATAAAQDHVTPNGSTRPRRREPLRADRPSAERPNS